MSDRKQEKPCCAHCGKTEELVQLGTQEPRWLCEEHWFAWMKQQEPAP